MGSTSTTDDPATTSPAAKSPAPDSPVLAGTPAPADPAPVSPDLAANPAPASSAPDASPRLRLQEDGSGLSLLDGGWWPRSADPAAELPGLLPVMDERHGRITRVMLGTADWDATRPHRLVLGGPRGNRVVKLGWFDTMPDGLLTALSVSGDRVDLVVVPPDTREQAAVTAMQQAATAGNREHAPAILAGITAAASGASS